jgi:hypothetical protein
MSSTHTTQNTSHQPGLSKRLLMVGSLIVLAAIVTNTLIALAAKALFPVAPTFQPLQPQSFIPSTVIGVVGAVTVFALLVRWTKQPARMFQRIAVVVLLVSLLPDLLLPFIPLFPGTTFPEVGALLLMHVATGLLCLSTLPRVKC